MPSARRLRPCERAAATAQGAPVARSAGRSGCRYGAVVIIDTLDIDASTFERGTGWTIKTEGACKADVCVPLPQGFSLPDAAQRLGMAVVTDVSTGLSALGPESFGGRALVSAEAPELVLSDLAGNEFRLSSLRGQKVVLVAWAPY